MTGWSNAEVGEAMSVGGLIGLVLAQSVLRWRALRRPPSSTALPAYGRQRVPLDAYLWFGLAGEQWVPARKRDPYD
jgi:hypothetical protein